jgi:hypothetical protein
MNLKEAFRFQNKLQAFIDEALQVLDREENVITVKNTYLRHKVMPEAEDETVLVAPETEYYEKITELTCFLLHLTEEKQKRFTAIRKAKNALSVDLDSETGMNITRQRIARTLKWMNDLRSTEQTLVGSGTGYRFNADGNQVSYRCDVRRVITVNFNRNVIRKALNQLNQQSDETSAAIDLCLVTSKVDYVPPFDVNASFSSAFEAYAEGVGA